MNRLLPCPACSRHVVVSEPICPFCESAQPPNRQPAPIHRRADFHVKRLGRAALFVSTAALAGCGASTGLEPIDGEGDAGQAETDAGMVRDAGRDAGRFFFDAGSDAGFDAGGAIAAYGGPVPFDAGGLDAGRDAGEPNTPPYGAPGLFDAGSDAGSDAGEMSVPLYGGPTPLYGGPVPLDSGRPDAGRDAGELNVPAYGAPGPFPTFDAGEEDAG